MQKYEIPLFSYKIFHKWNLFFPNGIVMGATQAHSERIVCTLDSANDPVVKRMQFCLSQGEAILNQVL